MSKAYYQWLLSPSMGSTASSIATTAFQILLLSRLAASEATSAVGAFVFLVSVASALKLLDVTGAIHAGRLLVSSQISGGSDVWGLVSTSLLMSVAVYIPFLLMTIFAPDAVRLASVFGAEFRGYYGILYLAVSLVIANNVTATLVGICDAVELSLHRSLSNIVCVLVLGGIYIISSIEASIEVNLYFLVALGAINAVTLYGLLFYRLNADSFRGKVSPRWARELLSYGLGVHVSSISGLIFDPLFKIALGSAASAERLGAYELSIRFVSIVKALSASFFLPLIPKFANTQISLPDRLGELKKYSYITVAVLVIIFFLMTVAMPIVQHIFSLQNSKYFSTIFYCGLLAYFVNISFSPLYLFCQANAHFFWNTLGQLFIAGAAFFLLFYGDFLGVIPELSFLIALALGSVLTGVGNLARVRFLGR